MHLADGGSTCTLCCHTSTGFKASSYSVISEILESSMRKDQICRLRIAHDLVIMRGRHLNLKITE